MFAVTQTVIEKLRAAGVTLAMLFGSRATGRAKPASDWDLGIIGGNPAGRDLLQAELEQALGSRVDLIDLRRAPPLLAMAVVREGKVLVDSTGSEFAQFASLSLRRYEDTRKLRKAQDESLKVFLAQRGLR